MARKIVFTSGKGGVGKTTVAARLGMCLAAAGERVALADTDFGGQIERIYRICTDGEEQMQKLYDRCSEMDNDIFEDKKKLFEATIFLQAKIHYYGMNAVMRFCEAYREFENKNYMKSFYLLGNSAELFEKIDSEMRESEYGIWQGFYENECLCDMKFSAEIIKGVMAKVRAFGEGGGYYTWQRDLLYSEEDRKVILITNWENHMKDEEIYEKMKEQKLFD